MPPYSYVNGQYNTIDSRQFTIQETEQKIDLQRFQIQIQSLNYRCKNKKFIIKNSYCVCYCTYVIYYLSIIIIIYTVGELCALYSIIYYIEYRYVYNTIIHIYFKNQLFYFEVHFQPGNQAFSSIYIHRFLNYRDSNFRKTAVIERVFLLIII